MLVRRPLPLLQPQRVRATCCQAARVSRREPSGPAAAHSRAARSHRSCPLSRSGRVHLRSSVTPDRSVARLRGAASMSALVPAGTASKPAPDRAPQGAPARTLRGSWPAVRRFGVATHESSSPLSGGADERFSVKDCQIVDFRLRSATPWRLASGPAPPRGLQFQVVPASWSLLGSEVKSRMLLPDLKRE